MPRQWRKTPYYKVQVFNATFQSWKDERKVFDTAEEARAYISEAFPEAQVRIIVVHRDHRYVLDEGPADQ